MRRFGRHGRAKWPLPLGHGNPHFPGTIPVCRAQKHSTDRNANQINLKINNRNRHTEIHRYRYCAAARGDSEQSESRNINKQSSVYCHLIFDEIVVFRLASTCFRGGIFLETLFRSVSFRLNHVIGTRAAALQRNGQSSAPPARCVRERPRCGSADVNNVLMAYLIDCRNFSFLLLLLLLFAAI